MAARAGRRFTLKPGRPIIRSTKAPVAICTATLLDPGNYNSVPLLAYPLQVHVTCSTGGNVDVQWQVSTDSGFGTLAWSGAQSNVPVGDTSNVPSGLAVDTPYFWRSRAAATGTTGWGAWSSIWDFMVSLATGRDYGYVYANVGVEYTPYQGGIDYIYSNEGVAVTISSVGIDYVYEGDVDTSTPAPTLWWPWKPFGFVGDTIQLWGQGMGTAQVTYSGQPKIDWGPDFGTTDYDLAIISWVRVAATADAYGPDRRIYRGNDTTPPFANVEYNLLNVEIPTGIVPTVEDGAQNDLIYVVTSGGACSPVLWVLYPTIPVLMAVVPGTTHTATRIMAAADPPVPDELIQQLYALITPEPYLVVGSRAERTPTHSAFAATSATQLSFSTTAALEAALDVGIGSTRRWLPDASKIISREDIGTGVTTWIPSVGSTGVYWQQFAASAGWVDPAYTLESRNGDINKPAFIMDGTSWLKYSANLATGPVFTIIVVAVLHPNPDGPYSTLLRSFSDTPDSSANPLQVNLSGSYVTVDIGTRVAKDPIRALNQRAVIIALTSSGSAGHTGAGEFVLVDEKLVASKFYHPPMQATELRMYLGRPEVMTSTDLMVRADILEIDMWDGVLTPGQMQRAVNKLDSIYGVTVAG